MKLGLKGGARMRLFLEALAAKTGAASGVRVGFLENATYPATPTRSQLHVAQVAFWNEFGTVTAPARPFFRGMIRENQEHWGDDLGGYLKANDFDSDQAFGLMGVEIKDSLTNKIATWPADNAESTAKRKGFNHGLVDSSVMQNSTGFEVLS